MKYSMKVFNDRNMIRAIHLVGAVMVGTYIYSPWRELEWFTLLNQVVVIPMLSLTGLWMWKGHKLKALRKKRALQNS